jgi:hypothetical protein
LLAEVRAELSGGLATDRVLGAVRAFVAEVGAAPGGVPRGERAAAQAALAGVELRLGIRLR